MNAPWIICSNGYWRIYQHAMKKEPHSFSSSCPVLDMERAITLNRIFSFLLAFAGPLMFLENCQQQTSVDPAVRIWASPQNVVQTFTSDSNTNRTDRGVLRMMKKKFLGNALVVLLLLDQVQMVDLTVPSDIPSYPNVVQRCLSAMEGME